MRRVLRVCCVQLRATYTHRQAQLAAALRSRAHIVVDVPFSRAINRKDQFAAAFARDVASWLRIAPHLVLVEKIGSIQHNGADAVQINFAMHSGPEGVRNRLY
jgi:hypothetical protein